MTLNWGMRSLARTGLLLLPVLALTLLPTASLQQQAHILYVNNTDPTCRGQSPCYATIQGAVDTAVAGDTIRIQAGTYQEQVSITGKNNTTSATEADRIIVEADPSAPVGSVILQGTVSQCTNGHVIRLQQSKYITIRGLVITQAGGQAISLMGGNNQNTAIHIERNRIYGNGSPECNGGITIARGNPDTLIVNNFIYTNGRNGITFIDADGGPHYLISNTIHANAWSGVNVARSHEVHLINNLITGNGTASGSTGGRSGVKREDSTSPQPAGITLLNNLICGNRMGEIEGPPLDSTDANNLTPTGSEGPGVSARPGCEIPSNVYANLNGPDGQPNTADDDFSLASASPAIDKGMDPRTLGLDPSFNPLFEADFSGEGRRPRDGNGSGTAEFDLGALESGQAARPTINALNPPSGVHGQTIILTVTGEHLGGATALTFLKDGNADSAITAANLATNSAGTELTATATIAPTAALGTRVVTVTTPEGTSDATATSGNTFTVLGQITLVPDFLSLVEGQSGGLTIHLSTPAPAGGLIVTLESANPTIATGPGSVTGAAGATSAPTSVTGILEGTTNITASNSSFEPGHSVVTVRAPVPSIIRFTPSSGKVGSTVVLSGAGFRPTPSANSVRFTGANSTWITAPVSAASATSLTVTAPAGAVTGPLQVTTSGGTVTSSGYFIVLPTQDFSLVVEPTTVTAIAGTSVNLKVSTVTTGGYTGLTTLGTGLLPAGVSGTFTPPTLGPNASGTLTLTTSAGTPTGSAIEVRGTANIEGVAVTRSASATLNTLATGQATVLTGQVRDESDRPLAGVSIKLGGGTLTPLGATDAAGNFLVSLSVNGPQVFLIDGSTASTATVSYASIPVTVNLQAGAVNTLGFIPHLHSQPVTQALPIAPASATPITFATLPDFQVTIPAGVQIVGWDGQPNTQIGVRTVPLDRLALPGPPPGVGTDTVYMFSFGKVGGGTPTQPIPVTAPNSIGAYPGQKVELWYYNEAPDGTAPNAWQMFGLGTVSNDGKLIVSDPGVGIPRFCCGAWLPRRPPPPQNLPGPETAPQGSPEKCPKCGGPIDLASGLVEVEAMDFSIAGRLPLVLSRHYRTLDRTVGSFGVGWRHNYEFFVRAVSTDMVLLITPENLRPRFAKQPDGTFLNTDYPRYRASRLTRNPDTTWTLRFKDGITWTFNSAGWLTAQRDRNGNQLTITRDSQNRTSRLTDPAGRSLTFSYSGSGLTVQQVTDPIGRTVLYTYDANDRLALVTDPMGNVTRYTYDPEGRLETITDPRGNITERNTYDSAGRVIQQVQADGGTFQISYQVVGGTIVQATETDPNGNKLTYRFGPGGYLIESIDPQGQVTQSPRLPGNNLLASRTDALGRQTHYTYDTSGNVTSITDALGNVRTFTFEASSNQVTSSRDPLGNLTTFEYDAAGNLTAITDPIENTKPEAERRKTRFTYNGFGQPLTVTDPLDHSTTFEYDSVGNLTATVDPLNQRTERTYDNLSRLLSVKDPKGLVTRFSYDNLDRLLTVTDPLTGTTTFAYDEDGNLRNLTDARGKITSHTYDGMNRLETRTDPLTRTETFAYDFNGNLRTVRDRKNQLTTHSYDSSNRRVRTDYADGSSLTYAYDPAGNLLTVTDSLTGTISRTYDALDRLVGEGSPQGAVSYAYDSAHRRTQMQVNGLPPVSYQHDGNSRLRQVTQGPQTATLTYDEANRRSTLTLPNGIVVAYTYDDASRLIGQTYTGPAGPLGDLTYGYDANGNRVGTGGTWARTGLPASVPTSTYDDANQQLAFGPGTQTFDGNGNLQTQTDASGTTTYTWDARNRLVAINGPSVTANFGYDALGRRISKTINGQTTTFHYDGLDAVRENGAAGGATYLRTLAIDEALTRIDASGASSFLADILGSTVALADPSAALATEYTYEPFGQPAVAGPPSSNPVQFTGRENDGTGLYYYRARYYDLLRGRFLEEDPIGFAAGDANLYAYVFNSPSNLVDPVGLGVRGAALGAGVGGVVGAAAGALAGATGGATGGALVGTAAAPGVGTVALGVAGGAAGAAEGAAAGAAIGAMAGAIVGSIVEDVIDLTKKMVDVVPVPEGPVIPFPRPDQVLCFLKYESRTQCVYKCIGRGYQNIIVIPKPQDCPEKGVCPKRLLLSGLP